MFQLHRRPWVLPDAGDAEVVAEVVERCPSGALLYRRLDGAPQEHLAALTTVTPIRNGPLLVKGNVEVCRADGTVEQLPRATLCRCGFSEHKPFCDNKHLEVHFQAPGEPFKIHLSAVRPQPDKPIKKSEDPRRSS